MDKECLSLFKDTVHIPSKHIQTSLYLVVAGCIGDTPNLPLNLDLYEYILYLLSANYLF